MKVAVYDRYWDTGGGGEKFAAGIAAVLAADHDVTLLGHAPIDLEWLGERLQLDLSGVRVEEVPADRAGAVAQASARYDLFVNASFLSRDTNRAARGVYVVHFPGFRSPGLQRLAGRVAGTVRGRVLDRDIEVTLGDGFHAPEPGRLHTVHWTGGEAELMVRRAGRARAARRERGGRAVVTVLLGRQLPPEVTPVEVTAEVDGEVVGRARVDAPTSRIDRRRAVSLSFEVDVPGGPDGGATRVVLRSPAWVPRERGIGTDSRQLGVPVVGWHGGGGWRAQVTRVLPLLATEPSDRFAQLDTYDLVLANSRYTQGWVQRMWGRRCAVLYPPVTLVPRQDKRPIVLSVGRFFVPGTGHNKKQLELVRAFRRLEAAGTTGYELHLVGGCAPEHRSYLDQVTAEAEGLPVVVHADATGAELRDLYGQATVFWHAAGLDEDPDRHPERFEHFGITTVEAMSAGAVPVVIDAAGQAEIVEHGVSGYRFGDLDELVRHTQRLLADDELRNEMSHAAEERARAFGWDAFAEHVRDHVE